MMVDLLEYRSMRCAICAEVTTDRATLQCNHTFCKPCLQKYTTTQPEEVNATRNAILCPTCRQLTKGTTRDRPVEERVSQLKPNLSNQELVNDCTSGSFGNISGHDELPAPVPPPESCFGSIGPHSTSPLSHDRGNTDLSVSTVDPLQNLMCREHRDSQVQRYCKGCNIALCDKCCSTKHDVCDVESIQNMIPLLEYRPVPKRIVFTQCVNENGDYSHQIEVVHDVSDRKSSAVLHHTIDCHTKEDKWCPDLIDVTVVSSSGEPNTIMIVADFINRSLKSIYTSKSNLHKRCLKLSDRPWQIAKLHKKHIAVSVPDSKEIVTVQLTPNPVLLSTIRTKKEYFALACPAPSQLLAGTFKTSNSVDLLDMEGHVLKSINTGSIVSPDYIQITDQKNILVGQGDVNSFVSVTSDGEVLFYYPSTRENVLSCPRGFATTSTGDVLLVDRDCKKVIQLTESGQFVRDVLTEGLEHPRCLCLDNDGLMYVTLGPCVNVFTFKDLTV
ncbi:uncharacterized protein LOC124112858 isoform X2 [Haliotis rufescens]|uniref:uncharacterized protein LOC124112858 isoform X2 n=1 Tax=Haliotis rufescens TaxID=6454 RepID=UPI00201F8D7B|nr:uncharacterized protein LOC124112858 isoform X2 [Haliotis rufescens]XP_048254937.1 uncharacterized protein LOC124112858 isoform X2 [Haliotis rufescens]